MTEIDPQYKEPEYSAETGDYDPKCECEDLLADSNHMPTYIPKLDEIKRLTKEMRIMKQRLPVHKKQSERDCERVKPFLYGQASIKF